MPAATFGGIDTALVTDDMLKRYWRLRFVNLVGITVCLLLVSALPIAIASSFAHAEVADFFGDEVYFALGSLALLSLFGAGVELLRMRRFRSLEAFHGALPTMRPELTPFHASLLNEIEIVLVRGALPAITAASLFVTVLRLASKDSAFEQQSLFSYYAFAYFALFGMLLLSLVARRAYLGVAIRRSVVSAPKSS